MPKKPMDYSRTVIYKLVCRDVTVTDTYVGSTTDLTKRRFAHKSRCHNPNNQTYTFKVYQFIRANGGWDNWQVVLVERFPCTSWEERAARERHWVEVLGAGLNSINPFRTTEEKAVDQCICCICIVCECGKIHVKKNTALHSRSRRHQKYLSTLPILPIKPAEPTCIKTFRVTELKCSETFLVAFARNFIVGSDLRVSKKQVEDVFKTSRASVMHDLRLLSVPFSYESQERHMIDGDKIKGFYHGFGFKRVA